MLYPLIQLRHFLQRPIPFIHQQWKKNGDFFSLYIGHKKIFFITDPYLIQSILNDDNYRKCRFIFDKIIPITGEQGIIQLEGNAWENIRTVTQPNFHRNALEAYLPIFEDTLQYIKTHLLDKESNFFEITTRYALATIMQIVLGVTWDNNAKKIAEKFIQLNQECGQRFRSVLAPPLWLPTPKNQQLKQQRHQLLNLIEKKLNRLSSTNHCSFYSGLINQETNFPTLDQITTFLFAGFETTAASIAFTFYLLAKHPEIQDNIYREINKTLSSTSSLTLHHLKSIKYTQAVYQESLRLYPPAWILAREVQTTTSLNGTTIRPGAIVLINIRGLHRHPDYWSSPQTFLPERFINTPLVHKYAYIPFGMGKRICSGFQLAMCEATYFIAKMISDYKFELKEHGRLTTKAMITQHPDKKIEIKAVKR